jgi:transposase InsO family protein
VVELKACAPHRASTKIRHLLSERYGIEISRQSVWRILSGRGLARIEDPQPLTRFQRPQPNQLWQMDPKEAVSFPFGVAHLLVALDDASRCCVGGAWITDNREPTVLGALAQLLARAGLPEAILTDRDSLFCGPATRHSGVSTYRLALEAMSIKPIFARAYKPRTKGKIEKFVGFAERDFIWEVKDSIPSLLALQRRWEEWCTWYNQRCPHTSLGEQPPAHRYTPSRRAAPRELRQLLAVETVRRVRRAATISIGGKPFAVPAALMGKHVWVGLLGDQITIEHAGHVVATYTR